MRSVLHKQQIVDDDNCPFGCQTSETVEHFALECGCTKQILTALGIHFNEVSKLEDIYGVARKQCTREKEQAWDMVITAIHWNI